MTPIKIPDTCKPTSEILYGYSGGMALYVSNWRSVLMLFTLKSNEFVLRYEQCYTPNLN